MTLTHWFEIELKLLNISAALKLGWITSEEAETMHNAVLTWYQQTLPYVVGP